jgi:hypothetical protein
MPYEDLSKNVSEDILSTSNRLLHIEGLVFNIAVEAPAIPETNEGRFSICYVQIGDERCKLHVTLPWPSTSLESRFQGQKQNLLMLTRGELLNECIYQLLLPEWVDGIAYRLEAVTLKVPGEKLDRWKDAGLVRKRFWLG